MYGDLPMIQLESNRTESFESFSAYTWAKWNADPHNSISFSLRVRSYQACEEVGNNHWPDAGFV
jgi:hypothetical protein